MTVKSRLLEILEQNKGKTLSGEALAEELDCTRAAVWKAVKGLREEGYTIEAGPNKGYMLSPESNLLSAEAIRLHLDTPSKVMVYKEVDSTNREARKAAMEREAGEGSVIVAHQQNAGRGRRGRTFYSPKDAGLYMSIILEPKGKLKDNLFLTTSAATAVYRAVKKVCGISLEIKWVNDLFFNGKKVCGILTEAVTDFESGDIQFAVVGIGLNLYWEKGKFPRELENVAGALCSSKEEAGRIDRNFLVAEIVNCLLEEVKEQKISQIYVRHNMVPGKKIRILDGEKIREAEAIRICSDGKLLVREKNGEETALSYGEVSILVEEK